MTKILRGPVLDDMPVDVPAPPAWDSVALAAYEQGYQEGLERGRLDVGALERQLLDAVLRCEAAQDAAREAMAHRVLEVAELFVTTTLRHVPEARTAGMLVRLGEVLRSFDAGPVEVAVSTDLVADVERALVVRGGKADQVTVVADQLLAPGEFRLHSEWADADGTFDRYLAAAREALELALAGGSR